MRPLQTISLLLFAACSLSNPNDQWIVSLPSTHYSSFFFNTSSPDGLLTQRIQGSLHAHQNPTTCADKKFALALSHNWGHGSSFHQMSRYLGASYLAKRIMLYANDWVWSQDPLCSFGTPECYFAPISKCQREINISSVIWKSLVPEGGSLNESALEAGSQHKYITSQGFTHTLLPRFDDVKVTYQWWTGQGLRFIMRPTSAMMAKMSKTLLDKLMVLGPSANSAINIMLLPSVAHPPEGCIGIHIRHGDICSEMKLHDLREYLDAADKLVAEHGLVKHVILGTDDEHVLERLQGNVSERRGYTFYYTKFDRKNEGGSSMDYSLVGPGRHNYTVDAMLNLFLLTHNNIGGYVETSASNWNGMIHELIASNGQPSIHFVNLHQGRP